MNNIRKRIAKFQKLLIANKYDAWIIPGSDPHMSEYTPDYWKERFFISGFTGSAGQVVITQTRAALWTDGRYYLQANEELAGTGIELMKDRLIETPSIPEWLNSVLPEKSKVAINPLLFSKSNYDTLQDKLAEKSNQLISADDLVSSIWDKRPALPSTMFFALTTDKSGETVDSKLKRVREQIYIERGDTLLVTALDDIAWLFNMRASDIDCNPVGLAYAIIEKNKAYLFTDTHRISAEAQHILKESNVVCLPYNTVFTQIAELSSGVVLYDAQNTNMALLNAIPKRVNSQALSTGIIPIMKAIKNSTELAGFKNAMIKDGVALVKFFMWLENTLKDESPTEYDIATKLTSYRAEQEGYFCDSFATISGYNANGAIIHYSATENGAASISPEGLLLLDSGGQYKDGTTDITRTIALGKATAQQKEDFTRVLKGHISLGTATFPKGTNGVQLDILARQALWQDGLDYNHGTGHGVGHFLNVHEGPQTIRKEGNTIMLQPGMVLSNEPGLYRSGEYGIRVENIQVIIPKISTEFGEFYTFETLTLFPIDTKLVDKKLLSKVEVDWLNNYHDKVYNNLEPYLSDQEKVWLHQKCEAI